MGIGFSLENINDFTDEDVIENFENVPGFEHLVNNAKTRIGQDSLKIQEAEKFLRSKYNTTPTTFEGFDPDEKKLGPMGILSAEAEISRNLIGKLVTPAQQDLEKIKEGGYSKYGFSDNYLVSNQATSAADIASNLKNIFEPDEKSLEYIKELNPLNKSDRSKKEILRDLADIQESRSFTQQIVNGVFSPSSFLPVSFFGKKGFSISPIKKPAQEIYKSISESVPDIFALNPAIADDLTTMRSSMVDEIKNPFLKIDGVPENAIKEDDFLWWLNMPANEVIDTSALANSLKNSGFKDTSLVTNHITKQLERLTDLGLLKQTATNLFAKNVQSGTAEAIKILKSFGRQFGVEGASDDFVYDLRPFSEIVDEIVPLENKYLANFAKSSGINPSAAATTIHQKVAIAYARATSSADNIIETILQSRLDSKASSYSGIIPVPIDKDGIIATTKVTQKTKEFINKLGFATDDEIVDTGAHWLDVFSDPVAFADDLSEDTLRYIDEYASIERGMLNRMRSHGVETPSVDELREGMNLIFRQVMKIGDVDLLKESSPFVQRTYETATEGIVGRYNEATGVYENAVQYLTPRKTLATFLKASYQMIIDAQLSDFLIKNKMTTSVTIDEAIAKLSPEIVENYKSAENILVAARESFKRISNKYSGVDVNLLSKQATKTLDDAQKKMDEAFEKFEKARSAREEAKEQIKQQVARDNQNNPGRISGLLFGDAPEKIPVAMWRNRLYDLAEFDQLKKGITKISGDSKAWLKASDNVVNTAKLSMATLDWAAPLTHGLLLIGSNPGIWSKATANSYTALANPVVQAKFIMENLPTFIEMNKYGVPTGDIELFVGLNKGKNIIPSDLISEQTLKLKTKIGTKEIYGHDIIQSMFDASTATARGLTTLSGQTLGRFQGSYSTFLAIVRSMLWDSLRDSWVKSNRPGNTLEELGTFINNATGALDSRALGVSANQRSFENLLLGFSPRLLRSISTLFLDAFTFLPTETKGVVTGKGFKTASVRQAESFKMVAKGLFAIHGIYALTEIALGSARGDSVQQINDEVMRGLNPLNGRKYLSVTINGQNYGAGGTVRAMTQLMVWLASAAAPGGADVKKLISPSTRENGILQFLMSRGALGVEYSRSILEGATFGKINAQPFAKLDNPIELFHHLFTTSMPFAIQGYNDGDNATGVAGGATGFRTNPESPNQAIMTILKNEWYKTPSEKLYEFIDEEPKSILFDVPIVGDKLRDALKNVIDRPPFPNSKIDVPQDFIQYVKNLYPEIEELEQESITQGLDRGYEISEYKEAIEKSSSIKNETINRVYQTNGTGKTLRKTLTEQKSQHAKNIIFYQSEESKFFDTVQNLENIEPSTSEFNNNLAYYFEKMFAPGIINEQGEYDFLVAQDRKEFLTTELGEEEIARIEKHLDDRKSGIEKEYDLDMNYLVDLSGYFKTLEEVAPEEFMERYNRIYKRHPDQQTQMQKGAVEMLGWTIDDVLNLKQYQKSASTQRKIKRIEDPVTEALLWKHGYIDVPINPIVSEWVTELDKQPNAPFNRQNIGQFIQQYIAELP